MVSGPSWILEVSFPQPGQVALRVGDLGGDSHRVRIYAVELSAGELVLPIENVA